MQNQHFAFAGRLSLSCAPRALLASLLALWISACAQQPSPEHPGQAKQSPDVPGADVGDIGAADAGADAGGVSGNFQVATFALGEPTILIGSPSPDQAFPIAANGTTAITVTADIQNVPDATVRCYLDGVLAGAVPAPPFEFLAVPKGYHTIACVVADANGVEFTNASARATVKVKVVQACTGVSQCADGLACTDENCVAGQCVYGPVQYCCGSKFDCSGDEQCLQANTANAKCATCETSADCNDGDSCTTDSCDLSSGVGKCTNIKANPECCSLQADPCSDGKVCTVDSCDLLSGTCSHILPENACCFDSDCVVNDVCQQAQCVDNQCRFGPHGFKPKCCSATTNPNCDDKNPCTIDSCTQQMGGWTQCVNTPDPAKPGCCNQLAGDTPECNDGEACTQDYCENFICVNKGLEGCCEATVDCDDNNSCTTEVCNLTSKKCEVSKIPECCNSNIECDDGKFCTLDACNQGAQTCTHIKNIATCCDTNDECDDEKSCTVDLCINKGCVHGPSGFDSLCCDDNSMCNDGNPCTVDACDTDLKKCSFVSNGDPTCCNSNEQCDDADCTTYDFCDGFNTCKYAQAPGKCKFDVDCDDGQPCTTDSCDFVAGCGTCKNDLVPTPTCCVSDFDCNDDLTNPEGACTIDKCINNVCTNEERTDCCLNDSDALTACDDNNACTIEYCIANTCRHTTPKNGCCTANADCNDSDECTTDTCDNIVNTTGICTFAFQAGCSGCTPTQSETYDDKDNCTADSCIEYQPGKFQDVHTAIAECCYDQFDCDDGKPCTYDYCIFNQCVHSITEGGETLCCKPETEQFDCAYLNDSCTEGKCLPVASGAFECIAQEKSPCTVPLSYCQDFESHSQLSKMGWLPTDLQGTAATNWSASTDGLLGQDQFVKFDWTPTKTNYYTCLQSPIIQAAGANKISMQFDRAFLPNANGSAVMTVLGTLDGAQVDWDDPASAIVIDTLPSSNEVGPESVTLVLPPELSGSNGLRVAMCIQGTDTFQISQYAVDNICVVRGTAPYATQCPANQAVLVNAVKTVPVKVKDPDFDDFITFELVNPPSFVSLSSSLYFWLDQSWNTSVRIQPTQIADVGQHTITVRYSDGYLHGTCTFTVTVTYEDGYLIWKPSEVPAESAEGIRSALSEYNYYGQIVNDLAIYSNLLKFDGIFITLGVYPDNHVLTESEVAALKLYLSGGGKVYLEGADTFFWDAPTTLHPFFKIQGLLDNTENGVTGPLRGYAAYADYVSIPPQQVLLNFSTDLAHNSSNDLIQANGIVGARNLLRNDSPLEKFWVQVGYDDKAVGYRTVGSSIPFAGLLAEGSQEPSFLIAAVVKFFEDGFTGCNSNAECDDGDACTADTCDGNNTCTHTSSCLCAANSDVGCADSYTSLISNGGSATQNVIQYTCDPANTYLGKETAYAYTPTESKSVTVSLTNVSNPLARVFVLKATANGCDPEGCIAFGTTSATFAGAAGEQYYIVVDVPGESDSTQFDLTINCGIPENCENGVDDNANGLVDCIDGDSCCGHASCQLESCNGFDDNCDGNIDEGCDDDGDGYCDAAMPRVGTPAVCPAGGQDCNDQDGTVNVGAEEICSNGKDDNCSGAQDEDDAAGCDQYYTDLDTDSFGTGAPRCLCAPSGAYSATVGGDCNDAKSSVNPGEVEQCGTVDDDDCTGTNNDLNAVDCQNFYTDVDADLYGVAPFQCKCFGEGTISAPAPGDCVDTNSGINPGITEICNGVDDNCNGQIDETCDDDGDDYCDAGVVYSQSGINPPDVCPKGPGDTDDEDPAINPEGQEICDDKDNDANGQTDEGCDDDNDNYCDSAMFTSGTPATCTAGGGDCADTAAAINPGVQENCATAEDDNCNGSTNDLNALDCTPYFFDADTDAYGTTSFKCHCEPVGQYQAPNPGDCNDDNNTVNPSAPESCDGLDNDCDKFVDDGCDDDGDSYCDDQLTLVGLPDICLNGGGDCNDFSPTVHPGRAEICGNGVDENCNGTQNDLDAVGCVNFYADVDADTYGAGSKRCQCVAAGAFVVTNNADCNDNDSAISAGAQERCNDVDDDCDGLVDEGCDDDDDGFCDVQMPIVGTPATCANGGGDCLDTNATVYPGKIAEVCDGLDDDCSGQTDNGCDDDKDGYCDAALTTAVPAPTICPMGGGDCNDQNNSRNPGAIEVCANGADDNCNGSQNDVNAAGCSPFYYDGDGDTFGLTTAQCLCVAQGSFTATKAGDCADNVAAVNPNAAEICDAGVDNDCDGTADEAGATGCVDYFYDEDQDGFGLAVKSCLCAPAAPYTAVQSGDCADTNNQSKPGLAEKCDNVDNNCDSAVDEGCNDDGDGYCDGTMVVVGIPNACSLGGGDCNDNDSAISPSKPELCNGKDDNCSSVIDEGCDDDNDDYCDANMIFQGSAPTCTKGTGDCADTVLAINPGASEVCGNAVDENCSGGYNDLNALGCKQFYVDFDGDTYGDGGSAFQSVVINEFRRTSGSLATNEYIELLFTADVPLADLNTLYFGDSQGGTNSKLGAYRINLNALSIPVVKAGTIITVGGSTMGPAQDTSYNPAGGDWNLTLYIGGSFVTTDVAGGDFAGDDVVWVDTARTGTTNIDSIRWSGPPGTLGNAAKVVTSSVPANFSGTGLSGVVAFTGDMTGLNQSAFYTVNATTSIGQPNGGGNTTLVNLLRNMALNGDSKCLCVADGDYNAVTGGDCNDGNNQIYLTAVELCDNLDNNCDGTVDEGCDNDNDSYCDSAMSTVGTPAVCPLGGGDCNDTNATINPGANEVCGGGDANCDGELNSPNGAGCTNYYLDGDNDGYGVNITQCLCAPTGNYDATNAGDCDDTNGNVAPGKTEVCGDGVDNDCDGSQNDLNATSCSSFYTDVDKDGYGTGSAQCRCFAEGTVIATAAGDCNDADANINPGYVEVCDGQDNNCNATAPVVDVSITATTGGNSLANHVAQTFKPTTNGTFHSFTVRLAAAASTQTISAFLYKGGSPVTGGTLIETLPGFVVTSGAAAGTYTINSVSKPTFATGETWSLILKSTGTGLNWQRSTVATTYADGSGYWTAGGISGSYTTVAGDFYLVVSVNPTGGSVDENCNVDGDLYCNSARPTIGTPAVCTGGGGDCNDADATIFPGATEKCDNLDNNCSASTDEGCDSDGDGHCDNTMVSVGTPTVCTLGQADCNDNDKNIFPGKAELCDNLDNNCSGASDEGCDVDNDNYCTSAMTTVGAPTTCTGGGNDCNDNNPLINPGMVDGCDGIDNNCAAGIDESCRDTDGDGYCNGTAAVSAGCPNGGGDCNDSNNQVHPGKTETCATTFDDNCNGLTNEVAATGCVPWYEDNDTDGYGGPLSACQCAQSAAYKVTVGGDCNDTDNKVNGGALEICDGKDNDCVGGADNGCDNDADGYCDATMIMTANAQCNNTAKPGVGLTKSGDDCDDTVATVNFGGTENCDNVDNNCNGVVDDGCDDDNDNFCETGKTVVGTPATCTAGGGDCNDNVSSVKPGAITTENCSTAFDDNCDGGLDGLDAIGCTKFYYDADGDGFGTAAFECRCSVNGLYNATQSGDCNDSDASQNSVSMPEVCDGKDNNCNGTTDENCDKDKDGFCDALLEVTSKFACANTTLKVSAPFVGDDCDDGNNKAYPGLAEMCDNVDNNCTAGTDEGCDDDNDNYCDAAFITVGAPTTCTLGGGDCQDANGAIRPGAVEVCNNGVDDNCNQLQDEQNASGCTSFYFDNDQDGYGAGAASCFCAATGKFNRTNNTDCNDTCFTCNPAQTDVALNIERLCDGLNNDCDGSVDEGCNADGDAYCTAATTTVGTPSVCTKGGGDCNDANGSRFPGALELCNGVDDNCNSTVDEGATSNCVANQAQTACSGGTCTVVGCSAGYFNLNGSYADGCECNDRQFGGVWEPNNSCEAARSVNGYLPDNGSAFNVEGQIVTAADEDWFSFYAADVADGNGACDQFNVRVRFIENPGNLVFEVSRNSCTDGAATDWCCADTDFNWFTSHKSGSINSNVWSEFGECPCFTDFGYDQSNSFWANHNSSYGRLNASSWQGNWGAGLKELPGVNAVWGQQSSFNNMAIAYGWDRTRCRDNSTTYFVRVYRTSGQSCGRYTLQISNGGGMSPIRGRSGW